MNSNFAYTPKYWVFHDPNVEDIFLPTMAKGLNESQSLAEKYYPKKFSLYEEGIKDYRFSIVEIKEVLR